MKIGRDADPSFYILDQQCHINRNDKTPYKIGLRYFTKGCRGVWYAKKGGNISDRAPKGINECEYRAYSIRIRIIHIMHFACINGICRFPDFRITGI